MNSNDGYPSMIFSDGPSMNISDGYPSMIFIDGPSMNIIDGFKQTKREYVVSNCSEDVFLRNCLETNPVQSPDLSG